jgi:hypothetical protein
MREGREIGEDIHKIEQASKSIKQMVIKFIIMVLPQTSIILLIMGRRSNINKQR